ncbi:hypothetical protein [Kangiella sp. TOML190]|uniref:hypothetical protein n=1 Tax=Kangiella sp. TOML190 TaxID=2931351 RepID=UPI0020421147|nr:hypothetical protein [Kangiella sp. TOML190]
MKRLAVAIIHGIGSEKEFYSVEFKHRVVEEYVKGDPNNRLEDDLLFHEIYWGDLVKDDHGELLEQLDYKKELTYKDLRNIFVDFIRIGMSYAKSDESGLYDAIHERIKSSMKKFASHRNVDQDDTPLVIMAHSFGSVIMSDYISHLQNNDSGLSNFEGFKTLAGIISFASPLSIYSAQSGDFEKPINKVGSQLEEGLKDRAKWLNFYDKDDVIAYPLKNANEAYNQMVDEDLEINVGSAATSWNPACHTGYWEDKDFIKPVAKYFAEVRAPHDFWKL